MPNVASGPIIGTQWVKAPAGSKFKLDYVVTEHATDPNVPITAQAAALQQLNEGRGPNVTRRGRQTLLEARGIHKRFNALVVLDGVDFSVGANEAVGIVGPNGAGKTTLLSVLVGAHAPTARHGRLARSGRDRVADRRAVPPRHRAHPPDSAPVLRHDGVRERLHRRPPRRRP